MRRFFGCFLLFGLVGCSQVGGTGDGGVQTDAPGDAPISADAGADSAGDAGDAAADAGPDAWVWNNPAAGTPCTLTDSDPVVVTQNGQVVEKLRITSSSSKEDCITVNGFSNVIIRNVEIHHCGSNGNGMGITFSNAPGLHISNVVLIDTCAPATGALPSEMDGIWGTDSTGVDISNVRSSHDSSSIYLNNCNGAHIQFLEGHDVRGPFPRGQLVFIARSVNVVLEDFSAEISPVTSWPEDLVNVYKSTGVIVRRGLVDGNNSVTGDGIMFENSDAGTMQEIDAVHQANGCFSSYPGFGNIYQNTHCRDNICTDQGRGPPSSGGLPWAGGPGSTNLQILTSTYHNLCGGGALVWDKKLFTTVDLTDVDFTPKPPLRLNFCWTPPPP